MRRTRIKICGITRVEDAVIAAEAGADAIGFVLHPGSRRNVSIETAARIMQAVPAFVTPVGLFVDEPAEHVQRIAAELGLRDVQLHGHESREMVASLQRLVVLKAIRVEADFERTIAQWRDVPNLKGIVLETSATQPGGTGIENDWQRIEHAAGNGSLSALPPIIAAGGLKPVNVAQVVRRLRPWAVDVSSGVEASLGQKSQTLVRDFIAAVGSADDQPSLT
jgi:phosphoribosylanthranilate isomerase